MNKITIGFYLIKTELQCLSYLAIRENISHEKYFTVTTSRKIYNFLSKKENNIYYLKENPYHKLGWLGLTISIYKNIRFLKKKIKSLERDPKKIIFYTARIDTFFSNLVVGFIVKEFKRSDIEVSFITDGTINIVNTEPDSILEKKLERHQKRLKSRSFLKLNFFSFRGDPLGANAEIVKNIYLFNGMPTSYPKEKVRYVNFPFKNIAYANDKKKALVIGQKIKYSSRNSDVFLNHATQAILDLVQSEGIREVDYIPHPRSNYNEFFNESFKLVEEVPLCSELLIAKGNYSHVFSCSSSVLLNSKIICENNIKVYSVGLNTFPNMSNQEKNTIKAYYKDLNIITVDV